MIDRLAQAAPGAGGASPDGAGQQLSAQFSQLQNADPQMMLKLADQLKAMLTVAFVRMSFAQPEAARHAAQAQKSIDSMITALQKGAATTNTVAPIANNAAMTPPGGAQPGGPMGGASMMGGIGS